MNRGYRKDKYSNKPIRWNSYGITEFVPEEEKELDNIVEIPMVLLFILAIIIVLVNIIPGVV